MEEIWKQNSVNGPRDREAIVKTILRDETLELFEASIKETMTADEHETITNEDIDSALDAVGQRVFMHRALERQKGWMMTVMKKPQNMKYRVFQSKVLRMNKCLPRFPGATLEDKFKNKELIRILENSLPQRWKNKFDYDDYTPTDYDRKRLMKECEAIERNEPDPEVKEPLKKKARKNRNKNKNEKDTQSNHKTQKKVSIALNMVQATIP